jgi:hypothetical protein
MPTDLSAIDLATLNAAQGVIVAALRDQCCQWENQSADAAAAPSASKVDASPFRSPRGLDGAEQCVATARPSRLM